MWMTNFQQKNVDDLLVIFFSFSQYSKKSLLVFRKFFRGETQTVMMIIIKFSVIL